MKLKICYQCKEVIIGCKDEIEERECDTCLSDVSKCVRRDKAYGFIREPNGVCATCWENYFTMKGVDCYGLQM